MFPFKTQLKLFFVVVACFMISTSKTVQRLPVVLFPMLKQSDILYTAQQKGIK